MCNFFLFGTFFLIPLSENVFANTKIYLIRHARVQVEIPGWSSSKIAYQYKQEYNINPIEVFDPAIVLKKIDNPETIDSVFCSPQLRAVQTAGLLFNNQAVLNINENLMELQYPVIQWPVIKMPVRVWLTTSMIFWMAGNNHDSIPTYQQRKQSLENYSDEIIDYTERHGRSIVIAHGVVNRELIRILKKKGWKFEHKDGFGNLSVNCLEK